MRPLAWRVGLFALLGLALLLAAIIGSTRWFAATESASMRFDSSVFGLQVGAPVVFRGVRIGQVTAFGLAPLGPGGVSVPVTAGSSFVPGRATPLFNLPVSIQTNSSGAYGYDAAADGQRFLVSLPPDSASAKAPAIPLTVITNWTMLLKKGAR